MKSPLERATERQDRWRARGWESGWDCFLDVGVSLLPLWIVVAVLAAVGVEVLVGLF